jgi:phosphate transport system substrate-binding protein
MLAGTAAIGMSAAGAAAVGVAPALAAQTVIGGGSTLVAPLVNDDWTQAYNVSQSNYSFSQFAAVGSGTGIKNVESGNYNYAGSDLPLSGTAGAYAAVTSGAHATGVLQLPWALSATGVTYYLPGVHHTVKLDGKVIAEIYEGRITKWNSSAIQKLNTKRVKVKKHGKKVTKTEDFPKLPKLRITPIWRSDGSGDSYAFETFLQKSSKAWNGGTPSSAWPITSVGVGESGNAGVYNEVQHVKGAIGYVAAPYLVAEKTDASVAEVENAASRYEFPDASNIAAAAKSATSVPAQGPNFGLPIMYPAKKYKTAYPISTFTYGIIPYGGPAAQFQGAMQSFLSWVFSTGQTFGANADYVPLPSKVLSYDRAQLGQL